MRALAVVVLLAGCGPSIAEQQYALEQQRYYVAMCSRPPDATWSTWCAQHAREAERQQLEAAERQRRGDAIRAANAAYQAPYQQQPATAPRQCTSMVNGNLVTTSCF